VREKAKVLIGEPEREGIEMLEMLDKPIDLFRNS
jgi:hypothetical protein